RSPGLSVCGRARGGRGPMPSPRGRRRAPRPPPQGGGYLGTDDKPYTPRSRTRPADMPLTALPAHRYQRQRWRNGAGYTREIWREGEAPDWRASIAEID